MQGGRPTCVRAQVVCGTPRCGRAQIGDGPLNRNRRGNRLISRQRIRDGPIGLKRRRGNVVGFSYMYKSGSSNNQVIRPGPAGVTGIIIWEMSKHTSEEIYIYIYIIIYKYIYKKKNAQRRAATVPGSTLVWCPALLATQDGGRIAWRGRTNAAFLDGIRIACLILASPWGIEQNHYIFAWSPYNLIGLGVPWGSRIAFTWYSAKPRVKMNWKLIGGAESLHLHVVSV